jgi:cbb3-type cytochrome oxidase subunit 3
VTFWGELNRTSKMTKILGICLSVMFLGGVLIIYRRWKKQEYRPLNDFNDNLDRD